MTSVGGTGELLTGSYDCVDRIVLNAYFPLGHNPGGFRPWWQRWHDGSDEQLDDTHLMRMGAGSPAVKAWGQANDVPVICCKAGQPKHLIAEEHLAARPPSRPGVLLVVMAKAARVLLGASQAYVARSSRRRVLGPPWRWPAPSRRSWLIIGSSAETTSAVD